MKRTILSIFVLAMALLSSSRLCAQDVQLMSDTVEHNLNGLTSQSYTLSTPVGRVTFQAKHSARSTSIDPLGNLTLQQKVNNQWETIYEGNPGIVTTGTNTIPVIGTVITYEANVAYENISVPVSYRATELKFVGNALNNKQIQHVQTYMASFVEVTPQKLDLGEMVVWSEPVSRSFVVEHCNVARLAITSTNPDFAPSASVVAGSGIAQYAKDTFTVTFTPNIMGQHQGAIIVSNGTQTDSVVCRAKVTKRTPVFTAATVTLTEGDVLDEAVTSDCDNRLMLEVCNPDEATVLMVNCGKLVAVAPGTATLTAMQLGDDDYWNSHVETFTILVNEKTPTAAPEAKAGRRAAKLLGEQGVRICAEDNAFLPTGQSIR